MRISRERFVVQNSRPLCAQALLRLRWPESTLNSLRMHPLVRLLLDEDAYKRAVMPIRNMQCNAIGLYSLHVA